jgi:hypothetical protein
MDNFTWSASRVYIVLELLNNHLANSMERNLSWQADSHSSSQAFHRVSNCITPCIRNKQVFLALSYVNPLRIAEFINVIIFQFKVRKPRDFECYTPSTEPFRFLTNPVHILTPYFATWISIPNLFLMAVPLYLLVNSSVALVRERTVPTERPTFVGEVTCG